MAEPIFEAVSPGPPADGWRAIFSDSSGAQIAPLVCWACLARKPWPPRWDPDLRRHGWSRAGWPGPLPGPCGRAASFEGYLAPAQPDPAGAW